MRQREDDRPKYECSTCPAIVRAMRHCPRWPPPEVERLMRAAPEKVPKGTGRTEMLTILQSTAWQPGEERGLATQVLEALGHANMVASMPGERCPVLDISQTSYRFIKHYALCQSFGAGMGGMMPPGDTLMDSTARDVHAFNLIHSESERLRKFERENDKREAGE